VTQARVENLKYAVAGPGKRCRMSSTDGQGPTMTHIRRLVMMVAAGTGIFVVLLLALQAVLVYAGAAPDSSIYRFYPVMAALGAAFGFERWWAAEQGEQNPFHDK
jgi:hypothetical protein